MRNFHALVLSILVITVGVNVLARTAPVSDKGRMSYLNECLKSLRAPEPTSAECILGQQTAARFVAGESGDVKLDVTLNWDPQTEIPISIAIMGGETPYYATLDGYPPEAPGFWIPIPPQQQGVKQVVLLMQRTTYFGFNGEYKFLFFSDCDLTKDCELVINTSDADKLVSFVSYNPDGEISTLDNVMFGEEGFEVIETGNIRNVNLETYLRYQNHTFYPQNYVFNTDFKMDESFLGSFPGLALKDVYVNALPEGWELIQYRSMFASDRENQYTAILEANALNGDKTEISNSSDSYTLWNPEFEASLVETDSQYEIFPCLTNDGISLGYGRSIYLDNCKCWMALPQDLAEGLSVYNYVMLTTPDGEYIIDTPQLSFEPTGPTEYLVKASLTKLAAAPTPGLPNSINPYFSLPFSASHISGASTPFIGLGMTKITESQSFSYPVMEYNAKGSLSETLYYVQKEYDLTVACNGNNFINGGSFNTYSQDYLNAGSPKGNMVLKASFGNYRQDNLAGEILVIDKWNNAENPDDTTPPVLTFLQLKDGENNVTCRFKTPADADIAFSAGDFEPKVIMDYLVTEDFVYNHDYVEYQPLSAATFEVSPYKTDDFLALPVQEIPENLVERGFGAYYTADVSGLDVKSPTGWFDIRITLTDQAGYTQQQTISPAFKIESLSSIEEIENDLSSISVQGSSIIAPEKAIVYSADGQKCGKENLSPGVYIVTVQNYAKKLIIQ